VIAIGGAFEGGLKLGDQSFASGGRGGFIAAQARDGRTLYARAFPSAKAVEVLSVAVRANGEIVASGRAGPAPVDFGGGVTVPQGLSDAFVARYDARGAHIWSRRVAPADGDAAVRSVAYTADGDVVVSGGFSGARFALGNDALVNARTERTHSRRESVPMFDAVRFSDGFVARLRAGDGKTIWSRRLGAEETDSVDALAIDASGDVYVSIMMFGAGVGEPAALASPDWKRAIVKLDGATGGIRWSQVLSSIGSSRIDGRTLVADAGVLFVAGPYEGTFRAGSIQVESARGGYVGALDARDGKVLWMRSLRAQYGVFETMLARGPAESLVLSSVVVGPMQLSPEVKLAQPKDTYSAVLLGLSGKNGGEPLWIRELGARGATRPIVSAIGLWATGETWWVGGVKGKPVVRTIAASP
jgi:outer membrane protein assembly factor BamB